MPVLAIDQGTSGTKAVVVDPEDGVLATAEVALRPRYLPGGGVEQDPAEMLESVLSSGRRAIEQAGRAVDCISLANQGETVLAWDPGSGSPLSQAVVWQDRRAAALCDELADARELVSSRTALVLDPYFSAPKLAWLRRNVTREGVVSTTDTRSRALMQAVADLTQLPISLYPSPHATALGAAALGRLSLDPELELQHAVLDWRPQASYDPGWSPVRADEFRARWRGAALAGLPREEQA